MQNEDGTVKREHSTVRKLRTHWIGIKANEERAISLKRMAWPSSCIGEAKSNRISLHMRMANTRGKLGMGTYFNVNRLDSALRTERSRGGGINWSSLNSHPPNYSRPRCIDLGASFMIFSKYPMLAIS